MSRWNASALILLLAGFSVIAQTPLKVESIRVNRSASVIEVRFPDAVILDDQGVNLDVANVRVSPATITKVTRIQRSNTRPSVLQLIYEGTVADGTLVRVEFGEIRYRLNGAALIAADIEGQTEETLAQRRARGLKAVAELPKQTANKNIFASGFVTAANGGSQGGADISLNPDLGIRGMTSFLQLKKSTQAGGDAKHFEGGARYRKAISAQRRHLDAIRTATTNAEIQQELDAMQKQWMAGTVFDFAAKLEGLASTFDVSNFVGETGMSVVSRTKALGARKGFWRGFVSPFAMEGGQSLRASDPTLPDTPQGRALKQVDWIARYKGGLGMTLFYEDATATHPIRRVELDMNGVVRALFLNEAMYNAQTKQVDRTGKGVRGYGQIDLKVFVGASANGRYGVKLSYNRGSLPPAFARVKSFQFGFIFESTDDVQ